MKAFITGISGFTGTNLQKLLKGKRVSVNGIDLNPKTKYFSCDLRNKTKIKEIIKKVTPDLVFHFASPIVRSNQLIDKSLTANLEVDLFGTINLIEALASLKDKPKLLISGTAAEYDPSIKRARVETDKLKPNSSYGLSKMTQELVSFKLCESYKIPLIFTRSFLQIGPGQKAGFVVTDWCEQIKRKEKILKTGNLNISRDFTDINDGVKAYWTLMTKGQTNDVYNLCSGRKTKLREIINILKELADYKFTVKITQHNLRKNDLKELWGNNRKLRALGWKPEISLKDSLRTMLDNKN